MAKAWQPEPIFAALKVILSKHAAKLVVVKDDPQWYYLDTATLGENQKPIGFAAVRIGKKYVSFYLMPLYCHPVLDAEVPAALKKRQQGKSCFNFKEVDEELFKALQKLTDAGMKAYKKLGWVK